MNRILRAIVLVVLLFTTALQADEAIPAPAVKFDTLTVGKTTYRQVQVRSVNARTLVIIHAGGLASIRLRDLAPELQAQFHYDPAAETAVDATPVLAPAPVRRAPRVAAVDLARSKFEMLLKNFGQPAVVQTEVDLRPRFFELELGVKDQGRRPSCAVFAVVSALEFQNAELYGHIERFSEEYLLWAVRKTVNRAPPPDPATNDPGAIVEKDEGFSLAEVVSALRAFGIPLQASMPNTFGKKIESIEDPPATTVTEAQNHQHVYVHPLPGRDPATRLNNLVHILNAGIPVPIGLGWPNYRTLRTGYLSTQKPMAGRGHAVTLVGYKSATGRLEDVVFIFKNSWGVDWGQGGYGLVTYGYLYNYMFEAAFLEVQTN
jgi:hypothetical protein